MANILGAVLAGGRSSRFGSDKAVAMLDGRALIDHALAALAPHCAAVVVCGRDCAGHVSLADRPAPDLGPLGAINAALRYGADHGFDGVLVTGCDMPHFPAALVDALVGQDAAVLAGQQLAGWWPCSLADALDDHLAHAQSRSIRGWMARSGAREVSVEGVAMPNINHPDDLARMADVHVAVLAAGAGRRFGGGKLDADLAGRPVALWALAVAQSLGARVHVVSGPDVPSSLARCDGLSINADAASGMGSSLRHAVGLAGGARRLLVVLADMPCVTPDLLRALIAQEGTAACVYPDGRLGPPACFDAADFAALGAAQGDRGVGAWLNQAAHVRRVAADSAMLIDVDTVDDLARAAVYLAAP